MTIAERSRRRVRDALDRLEREYGPVEVVEKTWEHPPEAYRQVRQRFEAGTLGGGGTWITDDAGRVLLVRHEGESAWSDPGGQQEPDESIETAALRETKEETGVEAEITGVRQVHRLEILDDASEKPPIHRLIVIFDGEHVSGEIRPREGEIAEVRWWGERPEDLLYDELAEFPIPAAE
ncbi:NUDIX domain-containing protein [Halorussus salinisoli]|uniref:NUDIX domain-containing protein n=1 Tax=Halorussus salinisoli TaxID=2558242 RepID=UPI0010C23454|nr:NUDIX domain-containing protein [Halorussus salinisoli]